MYLFVDICYFVDLTFNLHYDTSSLGQAGGWSSAAFSAERAEPQIPGRPGAPSRTEFGYGPGLTAHGR